MNIKYAYILISFLLYSGSLLSQSPNRFFWQPDEPETVEELTTSLTAGLKTDSTKVVAIYKWITHNVSYDYSAYMSGEPLRYQSPELVYKRRKTTCTGYSNLMVDMLEKSGIRAFTVEGFTQDFVLGLDSTRLSSDHAWVAFSLGNSWYVADPTWDAGDIGIMKYSNKEANKRRFLRKVFSFSITDIFKSEKRKQIQNKTYTRERVTYKIGFNRIPTMDYLFADPDVFLKTHLPNVAHIQMKSKPLSIKQFCDSSNALGDVKYSDLGDFNYNAVNDKFYSLQEPERMLWLADSALNFNHVNHGDKTLNAHNYLAYFNGGRTNSRYLLEKFKSISDTVITHGNIAISINRAELKLKKKEFSSAFEAEKGLSTNQNTNATFIRFRLSSNAEIYRKERERILSKELMALNRIEESTFRKYGTSVALDKPASLDSIKELRTQLVAFNKLVDSVRIYQHLENIDAQTIQNRMDSLFSKVHDDVTNGSNAMKVGLFLNESELIATDKKINADLQVINSFLKDSVNSYMSNKKSYGYLLKLDHEAKKISANIDDINKHYSDEDILLAKKYLNSVVANLAGQEKLLIHQKLEDSKVIESAISGNYSSQFRYLNMDLADLNSMRSMRQAYLTKMLDNKYNRSIKVYTLVIGNAKKWKSDINSRLKELDATQ